MKNKIQELRYLNQKIKDLKEIRKKLRCEVFMCKKEDSEKDLNFIEDEIKIHRKKIYKLIDLL